MFKILTVLSVIVGVLAAKAGGSCGAAAKTQPRFPGLEKLLALVVVLSFAVLAATGFYASLFGHRLGGYALLGHTASGGAFAVCLALLAVFRAEANGCNKCLFSVFLLGGLGVVLTAVLMMQPFFGTHGQETLVALHRYSALVALIGGIGSCGSALRAKVA